MKKLAYILLTVCGTFVLMLYAMRISNGNAPISQAYELDFQTPPPPPDVIPTDDPNRPGPTTVPLAMPLSAEQALAKALELDGYVAEREQPLTDAMRRAIAVTQYKTLAEADAAIGRQSRYAPDIEADAGAVWVVVIPGRTRIVGGGPGHSSTNAEATEERWLEGVAYKFSARTGELLGISAGELQAR